MDRKIIQFGRRVGNTTRQIDEEIQELFQTGKTFVKDHARVNPISHEIRRAVDKYHSRILFRRLLIEHNLQLKKDFTYDEISGEIKLINHE